MDTESIISLMPDETDIVTTLYSMLKQIDDTGQMVRRISSELRPAILDDLGLIAASEWQLTEFQKRTGIKCELISGIIDVRPNSGLATTLFRILQESLTNIARHSGATNVTVTIRQVNEKLLLRIYDNGKGISQKQISSPVSFGLMGMQERALQWGGKVVIRSPRVGGTRIEVTVPMHFGDNL